MFRKALAVLLLLPSFAAFGMHGITTTINKSTAGTPTLLDTPCFAPYKKQANLPTISANNGDPLSAVLLTAYLGAGDSTYTCTAGAMAPVFSRTNDTATMSITLTQSDPNNASYASASLATCVGCTVGIKAVNVNDGTGVTITGTAGVAASGGTATAITAGTNNYFVDSVIGNDTNDGLYPTVSAPNHGPWKNISKVSSTILPTGSDVYLKGGQSWTLGTGAALDIRHDGTSGDRVVVGGYYTTGSSAFSNTPDQELDYSYKPRLGYTYSHLARPIVRGAYAASCRAWTGTAVSCPTMSNAYLVGTTGHKYVTIQDLEVRDSGGMGIEMVGNGGDCIGADGIACDMYPIIQRNKVSHTYQMPIFAYRTRHSVIFGNEAEYGNLSYQDNLGNPRGGEIVIEHCDPCYGLVENNWAHDGYGEVWIIDAGTFILNRGNETANESHVAVYPQGSNDTVFEQNIFAGGHATSEGLGNPNKAASPIYGGQLSVTQENNTTSGGTAAGASHRHVIRNNLVSRMMTCMYPSIDPNATITEDAYLVGNTCLGSTTSGGSASGYGIKWDGGTARVVSPGINMRSNLYAVTTGQTLCAIGVLDPALMVLSNNLWTTAIPNTNCTGTNDKTSTFANLQLSAFNFATSDASSFPAYTDFQPGASSTAATGGMTTLTTNYLSAGDWTWVLAQRKWKPACQSAQVSAANFTKIRVTDYCGNAVDGTIGAINHQ